MRSIIAIICHDTCVRDDDDVKLRLPICLFFPQQTNGANHSAFVDWSKNWPDVKLVSDGAMSNEVK